MKKYRFLFIMTFLISNFSLIGQDTIRKLHFGVTLGIVPITWLYGDEFNNTNTFGNFTDWINLHPSVTVFSEYQLKNRFLFSANISNTEKRSISGNSILYKVRYVTIATTFGKKFKHWKSGEINMSVGPYLGYIYEAKKGEIDITQYDAFNKMEYGIELFTIFIAEPKWRNTGFGIHSMKLQFGLNEILKFRTISFSSSLIGFYK